MPTLVLVVLVAAAPFGLIAAATTAVRRAQARTREAERLALERRVAADAIVVRLAWEHEVEVERGPGSVDDPARVAVRGCIDGQTFCVTIDGARWSTSVEVQPVLAAGLEVHTRARGDAAPPAGGVGVGEPGFDGRYRVTPPDRADELPPVVVEHLRARSIAPLHLCGHRLTSEGPLSDAPGPVLARLRELLDLARALDGGSGRRFGGGPA